MKFFTVEEAKKAKLIQHSTPLPDCEKEIAVLVSMQIQVMVNPSRRTMFVKDKFGKISLWVDNIARTRMRDCTKDPINYDGTSVSESGKYKNIRHMAECLFSKNKDADFIEFTKLVKKEFPRSKSARGDNRLFRVYKHHIVSRGKYFYISVK